MPLRYLLLILLTLLRYTSFSQIITSPRPKPKPVTSTKPKATPSDVKVVEKKVYIPVERIKVVEKKVYIPVERPASAPTRSIGKSEDFSEPKKSEKQPASTPTRSTGSSVASVSSYATNPAQAIVSEIARNMVRVDGGSFQMGSYANVDEKPVHTVLVSSFSISKYELTQRQWEAIMGNNPSKFSGCDDCPVEQVSWEDTQEFLSKLRQLSGRRYRLPTEAEWEYAARGGNQSKNYIYSGSNEIRSVGWYDGNSGNTTHRIGQKSPNELGLYDLSGNVYEWCSDWYSAYSSSSSDNPTRLSSGTSRVLRGGGWFNAPAYCRSAYRNGGSQSNRNFLIGFRVVSESQ